MEIVFGTLMYLLYFFTNPIVLTSWIIVLLYLVVVMERKIRHEDHARLSIKQRLSFRILFFSLTHFLILLAFLLHIISIITTYSRYNLDGLKTKMMSQSTSKSQEGLREIFTQVFPYAERCSSTGSKEKVCHNEFIKTKIDATLTSLPRTFSSTPYRFVRFALNNRLEFLYPDSGIFQSYPAQDIKQLKLHQYLANPTLHTLPNTAKSYFASFGDEPSPESLINVSITEKDKVLGVFQYDDYGGDESSFAYVPMLVVILIYVLISQYTIIFIVSVLLYVLYRIIVHRRNESKDLV